MSLLGIQELLLMEVPVRPATVQEPPRTRVRLPPSPISSVVAAHDARSEVDRLAEYDGWLHASALVGLCARQYAIARAFGGVPQKCPSSSMRIVWAMGRALEAHVVAAIRERFDDRDCFFEATFRDEEHLVVGHPDATVWLDGWLAVEVKSMNARDFQALEAPLFDHVLQALAYRHLLLVENGGDEQFVRPEVVVLYVAKDFVRGSPYKEFVVDATTDYHGRALEAALDEAAVLVDAVARRRVPERTACRRATCEKARGCPVAVTCFNLAEEGCAWPSR